MTRPQPTALSRHVLALIAAVLPLTAGSVATAQEGMESPAAFQRTMDDPPSTDGSELEIDSAEAQGERLRDEGRIPGVSPRAAASVEEIVVQARRRAELLEDTPVAVTVLNDELLRQAGIMQTNEIKDLVPNMTIAPGSQGLAPLLRIRGIGTSTIETAFDPGVGFYVDGVFLPRALGQVLDTVDIAQIEVLRGPQGTLFGKNTVGGAVSITTQKPTAETTGFVMLRPGNFGSLVTRAMVNLPVYEDKVLTRLAISSRTSSGFVENVYRDESMSRDGSLNFFGSVRILPIENLTIDVSGQYSQTQNNARGGECVFVQPGAASSLAPGLEPACKSSSGPFRTTADVAGLNRITSRGAWGVIQYELPDLGYVDDVLLKSITSWRAQTVRQRRDLDQTFEPVLQLSNAGGGSPLDGPEMTQDQIQQELQFNGSLWDGRINFVTGFFSFWEDSLSPSTVTVTSSLIPQLVTANHITTDNFTWALYGQATADFTDWLSLTAGVRYTSDKKSFAQETFDPRLDEPPVSGADTATFTSWTPAATLALLTPDAWLADVPVDHLMGYFTYSQGFKGGGFNAVTQAQVDSLLPDPFAPETLDSFEIGVKGIGFDQLLSMNLALFYGDYQDIQVTQFETTVDPDGTVMSRRVTQNAASASTKGVELEVFTRPIDGLLIAGNLGYLDAQYDDYPNAENQLTGEIINRGGQPFRGVSPFQSFLSVQYSFPVTISDSAMTGWFTPRLEWAYRAGYNASWAEILAAHQRGYNLLNARFSYDFLDDRAQVALWAKNLLDEAYFDTFQAVSTFGIVGRYYDAPRTYGGELSYSF